MKIEISEKTLYSLHCFGSNVLFTASFSSHKTKMEKQHSPSDTLQYAVIKFNKSDVWLFKKAKTANLTQSEIKLVADILAKAVKSYNDENTVIANDGSLVYGDTIGVLNRYKIQLVPVINSKGEKEVWTNCMCTTDDMNWRKDILHVFDGGACFFNLKINLSKKIFYDMGVNGDA